MLMSAQRGTWRTWNLERSERRGARVSWSTRDSTVTIIRGQPSALEIQSGEFQAIYLADKSKLNLEPRLPTATGRSLRRLEWSV